VARQEQKRFPGKKMALGFKTGAKCGEIVITQEDVTTFGHDYVLKQVENRPSF